MSTGHEASGTPARSLAARDDPKRTPAAISGWGLWKTPGGAVAARDDAVREALGARRAVVRGAGAGPVVREGVVGIRVAAAGASAVGARGGGGRRGGGGGEGRARGAGEPPRPQVSEPGDGPFERRVGRRRGRRGRLGRGRWRVRVAVNCEDGPVPEVDTVAELAQPRAPRESRTAAPARFPRGDERNRAGDGEAGAREGPAAPGREITPARTSSPAAASTSAPARSRGARSASRR